MVNWRTPGSDDLEHLRRRLLECGSINKIHRHLCNQRKRKPLATTTPNATPTLTTNKGTMATEKKPNLGRVLITGGCGFLGHHLVRVLLRDWTTTAVSVVDLRCDRNRRPDSDGVRYHEADITDPARVVALFEEIRPDVVIHTASPPAQGAAAGSDELFRRVNVDGTRNIVDASRKAGVHALVYTSSASVASDNVHDLINADERWPVPRGKAQTEYYSETKVSEPGGKHEAAMSSFLPIYLSAPLPETQSHV